MTLRVVSAAKGIPRTFTLCEGTCSICGKGGQVFNEMPTTVTWQIEAPGGPGGQYQVFSKGPVTCVCTECFHGYLVAQALQEDG